MVEECDSREEISLRGRNKEELEETKNKKEMKVQQENLKCIRNVNS